MSWFVKCEQDHDELSLNLRKQQEAQKLESMVREHFCLCTSVCVCVCMLCICEGDTDMYMCAGQGVVEDEARTIGWDQIVYVESNTSSIVITWERVRNQNLAPPGSTEGVYAF